MGTQQRLAPATWLTVSLLHSRRVGSFPELCPRAGLEAPAVHRPEGSATHSEEWVPGVLEDPALGDRVGDFILQTEAR